MSLIDYILRHPVGKPQPPAYWDEQFNVALVDDFVKCVEFQDSSSNNISLNNVKPINYLGTKELNRNDNFARSNSVHAQTAFTVCSQLFDSSRSSLKPNSKQSSIMSKQLQQGMALPPFRRITRKSHSGMQTKFTFPPINYASFDDFFKTTTARTHNQ